MDWIAFLLGLVCGMALTLSLLLMAGLAEINRREIDDILDEHETQHLEDKP